MKKIFSTLFTMLLALVLFGQNNSEMSVDVQETYMQKLGHINLLETIGTSNPSSRDSKLKWKRNKQKPDNFIGRGKSNVLVPELEHQGPDVLRQRTIPTPSYRMDGSVPLVNIEGITSGSSPNDPSGDIGLDFYMQAVNATDVAIYDKEGNFITRFQANDIWNSIGFSSAGDPIILFDQQVNRWIITEFPFGNQMLFAISDSSDPLGGWSAYNFGTPNFPDYPKWSVWTDSYTVTTNEQGPGTQHLYAINRDQVLSGADQVDMQRIAVAGTTNSEQGFITTTPVDLTGPILPPMGEGPYFVKLNDSSWGEVAEDAIDVFELDIDWNDANNTTVDRQIIPTSPYDGYPCSSTGFGFQCCPQPNGDGLDAIPEVIMYQVQYRNLGSHEAMVMSFVTDVTDGQNLAGVRWVELHKTNEQDWFLYQEGTVGLEDGLDRYMSTIAMDASGNIGLAYAVSSEEVFVGLRYTARLAGDELGIMTLPEVNVVDGGSTINSFGRFGDYAHMSVDPFDDRTFWFTAEYAGSNGADTRIVAFQLQKDSFDITPTAVNAPVTSSSLGEENIVAVIRNNGINAVTSFNVGYSLDGANTVSEQVDVVIEPEANYIHTFTTPADFSAIGDYSIRIITDMDNDGNPNNNIFDYQLSKLPSADVEIIEANIALEPVCSEAEDVVITIRNNSDITLTQAQIEINLNGALVETFEWTGSLEMSLSDEINIPISGIIDGVNTLEVTVSNPNGLEDQVPENNTSNGEFDAELNGIGLILNLLTDEYPEETTWTLEELYSEDLIAEGGPYSGENTNYIFSICVDSNTCYKMTIFDDFGDGMNGVFGEDAGDYTLVDNEGNILANLRETDFGDLEESVFCLGEFECDVDASITVTNVSEAGADDGSVLIDIITGIAPFEFSLDGGNNFQDDNLFTDLPDGDYNVVIVDALGCTFETTVTVMLMVSVEDELLFNQTKIYPNPTEGLLQVEVSGLPDTGLFMPISILMANGSVVQNSNLVRYDDKYKGEISLTSFPSGVYYIQFHHPKLTFIKKVMRN